MHTAKFLLSICSAVILCSSASAYPTWMRTYPQYEDSWLTQALPLENGHIVFIGEKDKTSPGTGIETVAAEVDEYGNIIWEFFTEGSPGGIVLLPQSGYLLLTLEQNDPIHYLTGIDQNGNQLWSIQESSWAQEGLVFTTDGCAVYISEGCVRKVDETGSEVWMKNPWGETADLQRVGPYPTVYGGFCIAGIKDYSNGYETLLIGSCSNTGEFLWTSEWDGAGFYSQAICQGLFGDGNGSLYLSAAFFANFDRDPWSNQSTLRFTEEGILDWVNDTMALRISPAVNGDVLCFFGAGGLDPYLVMYKLDKDTGLQNWTFGYDTYINVMNSDVCPEGGFVCCGAVLESAGRAPSGWSAALMRLDDNGQMGLEQSSEQQDLILLPETNPVSGSAFFTVVNPPDEQLQVSVLDGMGRLCRETSTELSQGSAFSLDFEGLPSGVYTVSVTGSMETAACRVVVLRQ